MDTETIHNADVQAQTQHRGTNRFDERLLVELKKAKLNVARTSILSLAIEEIIGKAVVFVIIRFSPDEKITINVEIEWHQANRSSVVQETLNSITNLLETIDNSIALAQNSVFSSP